MQVPVEEGEGEEGDKGAEGGLEEEEVMEEGGKAMEVEEVVEHLVQWVKGQEMLEYGVWRQAGVVWVRLCGWTDDHWRVVLPPPRLRVLFLFGLLALWGMGVEVEKVLQVGSHLLCKELPPPTSWGLGGSSTK